MQNKKLNLNSFMNDLLIFIVVLICCVGGVAIYNLSDGNGTLKLSHNNVYYTSNDSLELSAYQSSVFYVEGVNSYKVVITISEYNDSKILFEATKKTNTDESNSTNVFRLCDAINTSVILNDYFRVYITDNGFIIRPSYSIEDILKKHLKDYDINLESSSMNSGYFYQINVESEDGQVIKIPFKVINYKVNRLEFKEDTIVF